MTWTPACGRWARATSGVGKRVKKMGEAFYGRVAAYDAGLAGRAGTWKTRCAAISTGRFSPPPKPGGRRRLCKKLSNILKQLSFSIC